MNMDLIDVHLSVIRTSKMLRDARTSAVAKLRCGTHDQCGWQFWAENYRSVEVDKWARGLDFATTTANLTLLAIECVTHKRSR